MAVAPPPSDRSDVVALIRSAAKDADQTQAVIATDVEGQIVFWNERAEQLYGYRAADALGRNVIDVTPSILSRDEAAEIMECLRRGEVWRGGFIVRHRDGTPMMVHVEDTPVLRDGVVVGVVGTSRRRVSGAVDAVATDPARG
jgi:PAS domain S-box-containing protein